MQSGILCRDMWKLLLRYVKFAVSSLAGTVTDTLVLWLLSAYVFEKGYWGEYIVSPAISFQCAVAVNFTIAYFYVWKDRTRAAPNAGISRFFRLYIAYNLSCSAVFLLRLGILLLIERFTGWNVVFCSLAAMFFSGFLNFLVENQVIFRKNRVK